jgi:S-DNA-T family DNA segregation ATPase FtsK/SpoIIIE
MIGLHPRKIPDEIATGRAFRAESGLETQVALLTADSSGQAQAAALAAIAEQARARDAQIPRSRRPFRVDVLPNRVSLAEAWELRDEASQGRPLWAMAGVGGDELIGAGPDMGDGVPAFVIAGPSKAGRSTMLATMARTLVVQGSQVVLIAPRNSPLRKMADERGVLAVFENSDLSEEDMRAALDSAGGHPVCVLIDDAEMMKDAPAGAVFKDIINLGGDRGQALIIAGSAEELNTGFSGWHVDARRGRRGALLSPQSPMDGDLIGVRVSRSQVGGQVQPGRALLHLGDGEVRTVQVPTD